MTHRKDSDRSEFWKDAEAASRRIAGWPSWKLGQLDPPEQAEPPEDASSAPPLQANPEKTQD